MPFISDDVAAFAKLEHAHRTRLTAFIAIVLALALFILPAFEYPITSITGNFRMLGPLDLCRRERDDCPTDPSKTKPGLCGCGVTDTDTDGDGTPDCKDGCPRDASKTTPGACGCDILDTDTDGDGTLDCKDGCPRDARKTNYGVCGCGATDTDTDGDGILDCHDRCPDDASKTSPGVCGCDAPDTDTDGDGTLDCRDDCIDYDHSNYYCQATRGYGCEICDDKFTRFWTECGLMCLSDIDYCVDSRYENWFSANDYRIQNQYSKIIQTGADSSNSVLEYWNDYYHEHYFLNGVPCIETSNKTAKCIVCDDGNDYCIETGVPPLPSNPWFFLVGEAYSMYLACLSSDTVTTSEFEMKPIGSKMSQYARAFFNHGT